MPNLAPQWSFVLERGPSCLYVRPIPNLPTSPQEAFGRNRRAPALPDADGFADQVWQMLNQHLTFRLVLEMDHVPTIDAALRHELLDLRDRIEERAGLMKLCNLSAESKEALATLGEARSISRFETRADALLAGRDGRA